MPDTGTPATACQLGSRDKVAAFNRYSEGVKDRPSLDGKSVDTNRPALDSYNGFGATVNKFYATFNSMRALPVK